MGELLNRTQNPLCVRNDETLCRTEGINSKESHHPSYARMNITQVGLKFQIARQTAILYTIHTGQRSSLWFQRERM